MPTFAARSRLRPAITRATSVRAGSPAARTPTSDDLGLDPFGAGCARHRSSQLLWGFGNQRHSISGCSLHAKRFWLGLRGGLIPVTRRVETLGMVPSGAHAFKP